MGGGENGGIPVELHNFHNSTACKKALRNPNVSRQQKHLGTRRDLTRDSVNPIKTPRFPNVSMQQKHLGKRRDLTRTRGVWRDPGNAPGKPRGFTEFPCGSVVSQPVLTGSSTVSFRADQKGASNGAQQVASQGYHNPDDVAAKGTDPCADESRSDAVTYDVAAENHRARHPPSLERLCPRRRRRI